MWSQTGTGSSAFSWVEKSCQRRGAARNVFPVLHHGAASAALSSAAFCLPQNYRDRCVSSMCVHIFYAVYVSLQREKVCNKTEACAIAGSHTPHRCTMLPPSSSLWRAMSGLWEFHCAESTGGEQSLHCAACPFGCLHAAFQRGAPSAFGSESLVDQAFAFWSLTRCAHSACCSSGLWGLPIIPQ